MKTTSPDGTVHHVYEDSDLDDEIMPGNSGRLILPKLIACLLIGAAAVFGVASFFCI